MRYINKISETVGLSYLRMKNLFSFLSFIALLVVAPITLQGCWEKKEEPQDTSVSTNYQPTVQTQSRPVYNTPQQSYQRPVTTNAPTPRQNSAPAPTYNNRTIQPIQRPAPTRSVAPTTQISTPPTTTSSQPAPTSSSDKTCKGKVVQPGWSSIAENGGYRYYVGYKQVSKNNQDAFLIKTDASNKQCFEKRLTNTPPDEKCQDIDAQFEGSDIKYLYVLCSTDGGNSSFKSIGNGFQKSYGIGGGPKVAYIAKLDTKGSTIASTFLSSQLDNGKVNTMKMENISVSGNKVTVGGITAYGGPLTDTPLTSSRKVQKRCKNSGSTYNAEFSLDLTTLLKAECYK